MQVRCATCGNLSSDNGGKYPVQQFWCFTCQQARTFFPVLNVSSDETSSAITLDDFIDLLSRDKSAIEITEAVDRYLRGSLTKDAEGTWVFVANGHVCDLQWVFNILQMHPDWRSDIYNIAMNEWR